MLKRFLLGLAASFAVIFLVATPASASVEEWTPVKAPKDENSFVFQDVDPLVRNSIESALEEHLGGKSSPAYVYVASLPETENAQSAARKVVDSWKLDRTSDTLVFYDVVGEKAFIWPATDENSELAASLGSKISPDQFASEVPQILGENNTSSFVTTFVLMFVGTFVFVLAAGIITQIIG